MSQNTNDYSNEIEEVRQNISKTSRANSPALEEILYQPIKLLDHGFVRVVDYMGDDSSIVQAARVSYGKGTKQVSQDRGLINYLMRHKHTTPFEMCDIKFHIKLPIFIARQWIRHRTASVNEYSARYSILDKEFYIPTPDNLASQSTTNNQGRGNILSPEEANQVLNILKQDAITAYDHYQDMLNINDNGDIIDNSKSGLARELARMNLPLNFYTQWYWKINLHNLLHFLHLRADSHAQYEIRVYADAMLDIVKKWVPHTYDAFINYVANAKTLSQNMLDIASRMIKGEKFTQESSGLSKREWLEFCEIMSLNK